MNEGLIEGLIEGFMGIVIKGSLLFLAWAGWVYAQLGTADITPEAMIVTPEAMIDRAFDAAFSLGLLIMFLIYIIYENKVKDQKFTKLQGEQLEILKTNIEMMKDTKTANMVVVATLERTAETFKERNDRLINENSKAIGGLTETVTRLEQQLRNG